MGAMASKKAREAVPVSARIASASGAAVRGPVAMTTLPQSSGGRVSTTPRSMVISGSARIVVSTAALNASRSTASAPPAGTRLASPDDRISEPQRRISSCSRPTALFSMSSERNELEQTSSARPSVWWASVMRTGRISCRITGTPARAICHAASLPANPPPMTWMGLVMGLI